MAHTALGRKFPLRRRCRLIKFHREKEIQKASLAQLVERLTRNEQVVGSSPTAGSSANGLGRVDQVRLLFLAVLA